MQLGSPASSQKQVPGSKAEAQHAQQAILNQLKEVPVKPVNAALLVEPLLDHGTSLMPIKHLGDELHVSHIRNQQQSHRN